MNRWWQVLLAIIAAIAGVFLVAWWLNDRRVPTLRFSHTLGRGNDVSIEWIQIK